MVHFMRAHLFRYREPHRALFILITTRAMNKFIAARIRNKTMAAKVRGMDKAMAARVRDMDINRAMDMGTNRMISAHA